MLADQARIELRRTERSRLQDIDLDNVVFGRVFSDHMFVMDYMDGAWQAPVIEAFRDLRMSPASLVLHYGQSIFEGMKAYRNENDQVTLFRPEMNIKRMNRSAERMCMPVIPEDIFLLGLKELVNLDRNWVPNKENSSLYIRPFLFASDEYIGVKSSDNFRFMIFTCPVQSYYRGAVNVKVEMNYSRAFAGGTGNVKAGGNYAAALYPAKLAQDQGFDQLIWTDAKDHQYIEESGTMNVFFEVDGTLLTPPTGGTILEGVTRDSIVQLARDTGRPIEIRPVSVEEIRQAGREGRLTDAFGAGTAATVAHIASIAFEDEVFELPPSEQREFSNEVGKMLEDIKRLRVADKHGWVVKV